MRGLVDRFRARFGDFWWYSLLLFLATRVGDLINAYIGVWLVPKYVPSEELGAVLPLTQFAAMLALPISVFGTTFMKQVNVLAVEGRKGEMKSLLRGVFGTALVLALVAAVVARFTMAPVLERLRIEKGMLGLLILATGFLGAVAPVYTNALQALKRFRELSWLTVFGAPIRLAVMVVAMPIRALSGYFTGQVSVCLWQIGCCFFSLRKELGNEVKAVPYWTRENARTFLRYSGFVALGLIPVVAQFFETLVIRQRLSTGDSAAYYMISKFAEIGTYAGASLLAVVFPYVSEKAHSGQSADSIVVRTTLVSLGFGVLCAGGFLLVGRCLLSWLPNGSSYVPYVPQLAWLTVVVSLNAALNCALAGEVAANRFGYLRWLLPLHVFYIGAIMGISGYGYFASWLPVPIVECLVEINRWGLNWLLSAMLGLQLLKAFFVFAPIVRRQLRVSDRANI